MKKTILFCLIAALVLTLLAGCTTGPVTDTTGPVPESTGLPEDPLAPQENVEYMPELYPYVIHTPSADWYIAQADLDLMGEDALYAGLYDVLEYQEEDFADARNALSFCLADDVPKVKICTDFSGEAGLSGQTAAFYNGLGNYIKVFHSWEMVKASLVHEYVHYLTMTCAQPVSAGFWAEGVAEYVSRFAIKNRMSRSVNMCVSEDMVEFYKGKGAWDEDENCIDEHKLYIGLAEVVRQGGAVGERYYAVCNETITRTEFVQDHPVPYKLTYYEAGSMFAWLLETQGAEKIVSNWDNSEDTAMEQRFGVPFTELYDAWGEWNAAQCDALGLDMTME